MRPLPVVDADRLYQLMLNRADRVQGRLQQLALGLSWSLAELRVDADPVARGLCFSPRGASRDLPWPGTLTGCLSRELTPWLLRWEPAAAVVGATVVNALINHQSALPARAQPLACEWAPQLAVFEHFAPQLTDANVVIVGRYPGLDRFQSRFSFQCLERQPGPGDLPDAAANWLLPKADWVFITASSIANKTLPHLLSLCQQARVVLMGPSLPWLEEWGDFGVDYLAGVQITEPQQLWDVVLQAGGTQLFANGLHYRLLAL